MEMGPAAGRLPAGQDRPAAAPSVTRCGVSGMVPVPQVARVRAASPEPRAVQGDAAFGVWSGSWIPVVLAPKWPRFISDTVRN